MGNYKEIHSNEKNHYAVELPKKRLAKDIKHYMNIDGWSLRKLADQIEGISHTQIQRVTSSKNYTLETLLKILDALNLEIELKRKADKKTL